MDKTIEALRRARKEKGLTLKEVSEITGISVGTVNKIFSGGINSIKTETAEKLARALGVDYARLAAAPTCEIARKHSYGFVKCGAFTNEVKSGDVDFNVKTTIELINVAAKKGVMLAVFPELNVTGYTIGDLVYQDVMMQAAEDGVRRIAAATVGKNMLVFVGVPARIDGRIYNCAAALCSGKLIALIAKRNLPNYNEFYERRYYSPSKDGVYAVEYGGFTVPFGYKIILKNSLMPEMRVACEICEDIWVPDSPSISHSLAGANIIANLSASNESTGKQNYRRQMVSMQSSKCLCAYVYCSSGFGESTTDVVFGGHNLIYEAGRTIAESLPFADGVAIGDCDCSFLDYERSKKFMKECDTDGYVFVPFEVEPSDFALERRYSRTPFVPEEKARRDERCADVLNIQAYGLIKRMRTVQPKKLVLGLSGGLDSTLALLVCIRAMKIEKRPLTDIVAISMPCFGTTDRTRNNAALLANALGVQFKEIDITESVKRHFADIGHDGVTPDLTFENSQARERTQVLMDYAGLVGGFVVGTGDMSEAALGWSTYNGDHMSMYNVNCGVPKTLVKEIVLYEAERSGKAGKILIDVVNTPISPELKPAVNGENAQTTEGTVGPYVLHDFYLYYSIKHGFAPSKVYYLAKHVFNGEFPKQEIARTLEIFIKRFFASQFKRSCVPDGVKTGSLCLSPRGDWRMPSDASRELWLADLRRAVEEDV